MSLIEHKIRAAWLHTIYLTANFHNIAYPLYVASSSSSLAVRLTLAHSLHTAARDSLRKLAPRSSPSKPSYLPSLTGASSEAKAEAEANILYNGAADAFSALSTLLGEDNWFFGGEEPGILDVSLFAYTHLLLDEELGHGWADTRVRWVLVDHKNLVKHRKRLYKRCFG